MDIHMNEPSIIRFTNVQTKLQFYIVKTKYRLLKSLMAERLEQASQWHEMCCHDLQVMSSNPSWVELGVLSASVLSHTWTKNNNCETGEQLYIWIALSPQVFPL